MMRAALPLALAAATSLAGPAQAQRLRGPGGYRLESRLEVIAARHATYAIGPGVAYPLSSYARAAVWVTGGGPIGDGGTDDDVDGLVARAEGVVRFHLDPFKERERGFYAGAGIGVRWMSHVSGTEYLMLQFGLERKVGKAIAAVELGVGDGARLAIVVRQPRRGYR